MVPTDLSFSPGVFYVVNTKIGSEIKVLSLRHGVKEVQKKVHST